MRVFVDSSALVALIVKNDGNHEKAVSCLRLMTDNKAEMVISNFVVAEAYNLLAARTYPGKAREWLLTNTWSVERVTLADEKEATKVIEKYSDKDFSYTDSTSFALIKRLGFDFAFTYDRHFEQYGIATQESGLT